MLKFVTKERIFWLAVVVIAMALMWSFRGDSPAGAQVVPDTLGEAEFTALQQKYEETTQRAQQQAGLIGNLRAKVEGLEARPPEKVTVYKTKYIPEKVPIFLGCGETETTSKIIRATPIAGSEGAFQPRAEEGSTYGCDSWYIDPVTGEIICNRPRFGHLYIRVGAGASYDLLEQKIVPVALAGLEWVPHNDSPWALNADAVLDGSAHLYLSREFGIF